MAALVCLGCTATYSVGAPSCPQCASTENRGDWEEPPDTTPAAPLTAKQRKAAATADATAADTTPADAPAGGAD